MANDVRPPPGFGCLTTIVGVAVLAAIVVLGFLVGFIALGVVAALLVVGLVVWAVDRVLVAVSPKRRERRAARNALFVWRFGQERSGEVIDTTAIETTGRSGDPRPDELGPDPSGPE